MLGGALRQASRVQLVRAIAQPRGTRLTNGSRRLLHQFCTLFCSEQMEKRELQSVAQMHADAVTTANAPAEVLDQKFLTAFKRMILAAAPMPRSHVALRQFATPTSIAVALDTTSTILGSREFKDDAAKLSPQRDVQTPLGGGTATLATQPFTFEQSSSNAEQDGHVLVPDADAHPAAGNATAMPAETSEGEVQSTLSMSTVGLTELFTVEQPPSNAEQVDHVLEPDVVAHPDADSATVMPAETSESEASTALPTSAVSKDDSSVLGTLAARMVTFFSPVTHGGDDTSSRAMIMQTRLYLRIQS